MARLRLLSSLPLRLPSLQQSILPTLTFVRSELLVLFKLKSLVYRLGHSSQMKTVNVSRMGMKVAAVSVMCQDPRVFDAMMNAGTPCPYDGKIGAEAKAAWATHQEENEEEGLNVTEKTAAGAGGLGALLALLLLL